MVIERLKERIQPVWNGYEAYLPVSGSIRVGRGVFDSGLNGLGVEIISSMEASR